MEVDYTGANAVCNVIKMSGLSKFIIYKMGNSRHSTPVYEFTTGNNPGKAMDAFNEWGKLASDSSNYYDMLLFKGDVSGADYSEESKSKKQNAIRFTFCLSRNNQYQNDRGYPQQSTPDLGTIIENVTLKLRSEFEAKDNDRRFNELEKKLKEFEEDDDDDELQEVNGTNDLVKNVTQLFGLLNKNNNPTNIAAINGLTDEQKITQKQNIVKAINILARHDDNIDTDLLKLASIAENNKPMFNTLISSLRTM